MGARITGYNSYIPMSDSSHHGLFPGFLN